MLDLTTITPYTRWLETIDKKFGRFGLNKLIVTLGESQSGKTEFTFFQARKNADRWFKVCYICLEMTKEAMCQRAAIKRAAISKEERDDKTFTDQQKEVLKQKYKKLMEYKNLDLVYLQTTTPDKIHDLIIDKNIEWYDLFYIDNLGFITEEWIQEIELTAKAIRVLKELTNLYPLTINLIHHFNKWGSNDRNAPRGMASIRSSGKIENDADYVIQVWRDLSEDVSDHERKLVNIYKQKDRERGEPTEAKIMFDVWDYVDIKKPNI